MFGFLKAKIEDLAAEASKFNDKQTAEAIVAVMTGTAYADGTLETEEKAKMVAAFKINPVLKQYPTNILIAKFNELAEQAEFDLNTGLAACVKEVQDVARSASEEKRAAIMRMGVAAAKADGEVEPAERAFLTRVAGVLGVNASQFGI